MLRKLSKKLYYPWYSDSFATSPWDRYHDEDFLRSENKRIERCREWYDEYRRADKGDELEEVIYYSLPIDLTQGWTQDINERGSFTVKGLSALKNDLQLPVIGLFPEDLNVPQDYSLVRILEAEKRPLINHKTGKVEDAIIVKEIEVLPDDHLYKDVPFEEESVKDILTEGLNGDNFTAMSLQSPILSSPSGFNKSGGIGMASMLSDGPMVDELFRQLQIMLPPEYRTLPPPQKDARGKWMRINERKQRIRFKVAQEESVTPSSQFSTSKDTSYRVINSEKERRTEFGGEYSFVGSLIPRGSKTEMFNEMFNKFTQTEITTFHLEQMRYADVDLKRLQNEIKERENLWLNIVYSRQFNPALDSSISPDSFKSDMRGDWEAFLPEMGHQNVSEYVLDVKEKQSWRNMKRLGQSIARADGRNTIKKKDLKEARTIINTSLEEFVSQDETREARKQVKNRNENERFSSVQQILQTKACSLDEIWQLLQHYPYFDNKKDLQKFLRWLRRKNHIIKNQNNRYRWI